MLTSDFDFDLPDRLIAQHPVDRGTSRMMVLQGEGKIEHSTVAELPRFLAPGDLLIANDTRVIPARLFGHRPDTAGKIELLLVEKIDECTWRCLARPGRRLRPGVDVSFSEALSARVVGTTSEGQRLVRFSTAVEPFLEALGAVPLPPYIKRPADADDRLDYQTMFAREPGAIAAPTAGLHFTPELVDALERAGVGLATVTLHVGIGTFKPVTAKLVHEHRMDEERFEIPTATERAIRATRANGGRVVAIGTTVVRTLEGAAAQAGGEITATRGRTEIFIRPGFRFQVVDAVLTNFHLPRSTLLMLVSAFAGRDQVLAAYRQAVEHGYRFFSYGDAMLLPRRQEDQAGELQHP